MHLSNHRIDLYIASSIRALSGLVVAITSSNCIMMSEPIEFCNEIECSGVKSIGVPSCGERNLTPSSVTLANSSSETIWNLNGGRISTLYSNYQSQRNV